MIFCASLGIFMRPGRNAEVTKSLAIWHISSVLDQYFVLTLLKLIAALVKS